MVLLYKEVLEAPADILQQSGLIQSLGMTRINGLSAVYWRIRREVELAGSKEAHL